LNIFRALVASFGTLGVQPQKTAPKKPKVAKSIAFRVIVYLTLFIGERLYYPKTKYNKNEFGTVMNDEILEIFEEEIGSESNSFSDFGGDIFEFSSETSAKLFAAVLDLIPAEQKDAIKLGLKSILKLDERDLVFFRDQKIFIRKAKYSNPVSKEVLRRISELAERYNTVERVEMQVVNNCLSIYISEILEDTELQGAVLTQEVKDFIKAKLRQEIAISDKDAVVFIGDKIIVRRFVENIDDSTKKMEQRYNGLPKEDLEVIRKKIFSDEQNEQIVFRTIMDNALEGDLNFSYITFNFFEKNYIKILQKYILAFLMENLSEDEQILLGVGNLALRENWVFTHRCMAEKIIELLSAKTPSTEAFVKCYSGDVTLGEDRTRYKMPEIIDKNDKKWNAPTIFSMVLQYKKNLETIDQRKRGADIYVGKSAELVEEIKKVEQEAGDWEGVQSTIEQELSEYYSEENRLNEELKMARNKMKSITNEQEKITLQNQISADMISLKRISIKQEDASSRKRRGEEKKKLSISKVEKLKVDIQKNERRIKEEELKVKAFVHSSKDLDDRFETVLDALSLALMKKRTIER
jgi:hypothetical protein